MPNRANLQRRAFECQTIKAFLTPQKRQSPSSPVEAAPTKKGHASDDVVAVEIDEVAKKDEADEVAKKDEVDEGAKKDEAHEVARKDFEEEAEAMRAMLKAPQNLSAKAVTLIGEHFKDNMSTDVDPNFTATSSKPMPFDAKMRELTKGLNVF